jgi:hypothetical protein
MSYWTNRLLRASTLVIILALAAGTTPLAAQQASAPIRATAGNAVQTSSPSPSLLGPRLEPEWQPSAPPIADGARLQRPLFDQSGGENHTFVFSTLALIVIGGLVLLLVVR